MAVAKPPAISRHRGSRLDLPRGFPTMAIFIGEGPDAFDLRSLKWERKRFTLTSSVRFRLCFAEIVEPSLMFHFLSSPQSSGTSIPENPPPLVT